MTSTCHRHSQRLTMMKALLLTPKRQRCSAQHLSNYSLHYKPLKSSVSKKSPCEKVGYPSSCPPSLHEVTMPNSAHTLWEQSLKLNWERAHQSQSIVHIQQAFLNFNLFVHLFILILSQPDLHFPSLFFSKSSPNLPFPTLLLSFLKREGLPWISTSHSISSCNKARHLLSYWGWMRQPSKGKGY